MYGVIQSPREGLRCTATKKNFTASMKGSNKSEPREILQLAPQHTYVHTYSTTSMATLTSVKSVQRKKTGEKKRRQKLWALLFRGIGFNKAHLFGEVDGISMKSVSQMRVQLEGRRNLHNLQNNRILETMAKMQQKCQTIDISIQSDWMTNMTQQPSTWMVVLAHWHWWQLLGKIDH